MSKPRKGFALLLTLAGLVLLSVLILVFLASAKNERVSSSLYTRGEGARLLREAAMNLVIAQIREGTTDASRNWISQPGAIRTYVGSQAPDLVYKLYSAREMIVSGTTFDPSSLADVPTGGAGLNANVFTDLNSPVQRNGKWNYPILDPAALNVVEGFSETSTASNVSKNTISGTPAQIPMPVRWLYLLESGAIAPVDDSGNVQSTFIKPDGSPDKITARIAFWTDDESSKLNINTASSGMYWDTPIGKGNDFERGNLGGGASPVVSLTGLASSPPAVREFSRFAGHPAMTSLDVVLSNTKFFSGSPTAAQKTLKILELAPRNAWGGSELGTKFPISTAVGGKVTLDTDRLYATVDELFYKQPASGATMRTESGSAGTVSPAAPSMNMTADNLSLARFFLTANSRAPEVTSFNTPRVTIWPVDKTVNNRTIFDKTIAFCSTVGNGSGGTREFLFTRSAFDLGSNPIGLQVDGAFTGASAQGSQNPTQDFTANNQVVYNYLLGLLGKSFPGFGSSLGSKFGADKNQILTEIYDYIRATNLVDCSASNAKPYTGRPWYFNEVRLAIGGLGGEYASIAAGSPLPRDPSFYNYKLERYLPSAYAGQVVPATIGSTRGFGRFPTVVGATLIFFARDSNPAAIRTSGTSMPGGRVVAFNEMGGGRADQLPPAANIFPAGKIRATLVLSLANPSPGPLAYTHTYDVRITGMQSFTVNGASANMPPVAINHVMELDKPESSGTPNWATQFTSPGIQNFNIPLKTYGANRAKDSLTPTGNNSLSYPFVSQADINVSTFGSTLIFGSSPITVQLLVDGIVAQEVQMDFASFSAPMPRWSPVSIKQVTSGTITNPTVTHDLIDCTQLSVTGSTAFSVSQYWKSRFGLSVDQTPITFSTPPPASWNIQLRPVLIPNALDTARGLELNTSAAPFGDMRLVAAYNGQVPSSYFQPSPGYNDAAKAQAISLLGQPQAQNGNLFQGVSSESAADAALIFGLPNPPTAGQAIARRSDGQPGDWDMGVSRFDVYDSGFTDCGAFINRALDCAASHIDNSGNQAVPYFKTNNSLVSTDNPFSPNRIVPSAGMFGSLSVGVKRGLPWQTLLFRPNIPSHPGAVNPPDHLILDLFQMPVVEPYAISDPFSTAGKVNLNYQIAPFSYIKRSTALRGVLYAEKVIAVPPANAYLMSFDPGGAGGNQKSYNYRYNIDRDATMTLFDERFANNTPFLTASQICEMPLVPKPENVVGSGLEPASVNPFQTAAPTGGTASQINSYVDDFWTSANLGGGGTADNLRERPYTTIYPRVTTKSNSFQIHMKVQGIQKGKGTAQNRIEAGDGIVSEYQGSAIIERFLDPTQATFDANASNAQLGPYKFRVVTTKQFTP